MRELRLDERDGPELVSLLPSSCCKGGVQLQYFSGLITRLLQVFEGKIVEGNSQTCGHVICTSAGIGSDRHVINYQTERVVGNGSFGVVFQAKCLETGETVRS